MMSWTFSPGNTANCASAATTTISRNPVIGHMIRRQ